MPIFIETLNDKFCPTQDELTYGPQPPREEPSDQEKRRYLERVVRFSHALNPEQLAAELLPLTQFRQNNLVIDGVPIQRVLLRLAETDPDLFKSSHGARIEDLRQIS